MYIYKHNWYEANYMHVDEADIFVIMDFISGKSFWENHQIDVRSFATPVVR